MIVLDTNIISELSKPHCSAAVLAWLNAQEVRTLYLTTINLAELMAGVHALPGGRRRGHRTLGLPRTVTAEPILTRPDTPS